MKTKSRRKRGKPDPAILADIVKRIVEAAKPEKIVLFGSAARGEMGPNSDYDLLVIKGGKFNYSRVLNNIYRNMRGKRAAVDVVLVTTEDAERYRDTHCLVICPALREGKVIYNGIDDGRHGTGHPHQCRGVRIGSGTARQMCSSTGMICGRSERCCHLDDLLALQIRPDVHVGCLFPQDDYANTTTTTRIRQAKFLPILAKILPFEILKFGILVCSFRDRKELARLAVKKDAEMGPWRV